MIIADIVYIIKQETISLTFHSLICAKIQLMIVSVIRYDQIARFEHFGTKMHVIQWVRK